jgi:hypothetical protein
MAKRLNLTEDERKHIATIFGTIAGNLQYRAVMASKGAKRNTLDKAWRINQRIASKVSNSIGYESWMVPNKLTDVSRVV